MQRSAVVQYKGTKRPFILRLQYKEDAIGLNCTVYLAAEWKPLRIFVSVIIGTVYSHPRAIAVAGNRNLTGEKQYVQEKKLFFCRSHMTAKSIEPIIPLRSVISPTATLQKLLTRVEVEGTLLAAVEGPVAHR